MANFKYTLNSSLWMIVIIVIILNDGIFGIEMLLEIFFQSLFLKELYLNRFDLRGKTFKYRLDFKIHKEKDKKEILIYSINIQFQHYYSRVKQSVKYFLQYKNIIGNKYIFEYFIQVKIHFSEE